MSERLITGYVPKAALSYVGIACFGLLALVFWFRFFRSGKKYMLAICVSTTTMALGFGARIPLTNSPGSLGIYCATTLFTLLSPCGFLAEDYVLLPRIATWLNAEDCLFLRSRIIVRLFVWSDVITFFLQASGSGMTAGTGNMVTIGKWITLVGLAAQCISFGLFTILTVIFGVRLNRREAWKWSSSISIRQESGTTQTMKLKRSEDWRVVYWAILWTSIGILVRCVYRVAEYAEGYEGYLRTTEIFFYVLDSLPLFLAISVWTIVWPPKFLSEQSPFDSAVENEREREAEAEALAMGPVSDKASA